MPDSLQSCGLYPAKPLCPWDFTGENIGVDCHVLLKGIFLIQELNSQSSPVLADGFFTAEPQGKACFNFTFSFNLLKYSFIYFSEFYSFREWVHFFLNFRGF